jgi:cyclopropane-fatty-acyl-phospholipid synthase
LPLRIDFWNGKSVAGINPPRATLRINSPTALVSLASPSLDKRREAYVKGVIDLEGAMRDAFQLLVPIVLERAGQMRRALGGGWKFWRHSRSGDAKAIQSHYDVSDEFFALWLDRRRVYSCAYFRDADDDLERAQEKKLDHICRKLMLRDGERFLDIGCGWGGLLLHAVEHYGVDGTGITLSKNQFDYANRLLRERRLEKRARVLLLDYRDLDARSKFDKIASVGMFEHVGVKNLRAYFSKIRDLLAPGGLVMNHGITSATLADERLIASGGEFIDKYVFPHGELAHVGEVVTALGSAGLECLDVENLRPHYARTLWHWVARLERAREAAIALVGDKKYRIWRAYMAGFAFAFESGWDELHQILAGKSDGGVTPYPFRRDHQYGAPS